MKQIPDTTVVIFVEDEVDKRSRLFKAVKEAGYACEMGYMNPQDLSKWIALEFKNSGKRITYETAFHLIDRCGTDMENLKIEIEKLSFYAMAKPSRYIRHAMRVSTHLRHNPPRLSPNRRNHLIPLGLPTAMPRTVLQTTHGRHTV